MLTKFDEYKILLNEKKEFSELKWISPEKFLAGICEDGTYRAFLRFLPLLKRFFFIIFFFLYFLFLKRAFMFVFTQVWRW